MAATRCEEKGSRSLSWSRMVCRVDLKRPTISKQVQGVELCMGSM